MYVLIKNELCCELERYSGFLETGKWYVGRFLQIYIIGQPGESVLKIKVTVYYVPDREIDEGRVSCCVGATPTVPTYFDVYKTIVEESLLESIKLSY